MDVYFLDSSTVVKRYVDEIGSERVRGLTDPKEERVFYVHGLSGRKSSQRS